MGKWPEKSTVWAGTLFFSTAVFAGSWQLVVARSIQAKAVERVKYLYIFIILGLVNNAIIGLLMEAFRVTVGVIGRKSAGYPSFFHVGIISDMSFRETSVFDKKNFYTQ